MKELNEILKLSGMTQLNESVEVEGKHDNGANLGKLILKNLKSYGTDAGFTPEDFATAENIANIYISKGERAGLMAQDKSGMSDEIDDLLNDSSSLYQRTIRDLDDQGVKEAYANEPDEEYETVAAILRQGNDLNRAKPQHPVAGFTGDNPLREEANEDEVRELVLYIENNADLYRQQSEPIMRNLSRKWDKGIYDHDLAQKLWYYLAVNGAKKYGQEHGTGNGLKMFSPDVRRAVAKEMADSWMEELKAGNQMDEAEEDLEAMLAEILIGEQTDEPTELSIQQAAQNKKVNSRPTVGAVATKLDKARDEIENRADGGVHAGFEPVSLSTPDDRAPSGRITTRFDRQR